VVHTYSGYEEKVKTIIEDNVQRRGLSEKIAQILIPAEKVVAVKSGKKKELSKKFYPGYILVQMELDDETWHLVNSAPRVTGLWEVTIQLQYRRKKLTLLSSRSKQVLRYRLQHNMIEVIL
jgi:transcription antitermination factor NusG